MTDMESLDRAVEEARADVLALMFDLLHANPARGYTGQLMPTLPAFYEEGVDALIAAVSAKARAEERERYEHDLSTTWKDLALESQRQVQELLARARSSEEAGDGGGQ